MFHILVVDDDKNTRMYFEAVLKNNNYTVTVAKNGEEALGKGKQRWWCHNVHCYAS